MSTPPTLIDSLLFDKLRNSKTLADFLLRNDTVGSIRACERARIDPASIRDDDVQGLINKLTIVATYCIRNGVTHEYGSTREEQTTYANDTFYRFDTDAQVRNGYKSTPTAMVIPIVANFSDPRINDERNEKNLVVKIVLMKENVGDIVGKFKEYMKGLSFGQESHAKLMNVDEFMTECRTLARINIINESTPMNFHGIRFPKLYTYGTRVFDNGYSIGSIVMSRMRGNNIDEIIKHLVTLPHEEAYGKAEAIGNALAYVIPDMSGLLEWERTEHKKEFGFFSLLHNDLHSENYFIDFDSDTQKYRVSIIDFSRVVYITPHSSKEPMNPYDTHLDPTDQHEQIILEFSIIREYVMMFFYNGMIESITPFGVSTRAGILDKIVHTALLKGKNLLFQRMEKFMAYDIEQVFSRYPGKMKQRLQEAQNSIRQLQPFIDARESNVNKGEVTKAVKAIAYNFAFLPKNIRKFQNEKRERTSGAAAADAPVVNGNDDYVLRVEDLFEEGLWTREELIQELNTLGIEVPEKYRQSTKRARDSPGTSSNEQDQKRPNTQVEVGIDVDGKKVYAVFDAKQNRYYYHNGTITSWKKPWWFVYFDNTNNRNYYYDGKVTVGKREDVPGDVIILQSKEFKEHLRAQQEN